MALIDYEKFNLSLQHLQLQYQNYVLFSERVSLCLSVVPMLIAECLVLHGVMVDGVTI